MAFSRKHLGSGQLGTSETPVYQPAAINIIGVVGSLTFYNTSSSAQVSVTIYGPHAGAAGTDDILEVITIGPGKSYICRSMVNKVVEGAGSNLISALASLASTINYSCDGAEEQ